MIKVFSTTKEYEEYRFSIPHNSIGIVPTMGNLHEGHISLLKQSVAENIISVITIYVNPKQFGPLEDFEKYPRTLNDDLEKISQIALDSKKNDSKKEIVVFAPKDSDEIYPAGYNTIVSIKDLTQKLEGKFRPDHFDGVTTVVYRLFNIVKAKNAYFGQKDYQQCVVVQKMILDLGLSIKLHILPIIRNSEGLALSSRNQFLSTEEKTTALHLPQTLKKIETLIKKNEDYKLFIAKELLDTNWDYLEVLNAKNLENPNLKTSKLIVIGVYRLRSTRLLDNILVQTL